MLKRGLIAAGLVAMLAGAVMGQGLNRITGTETQWRNSIFQVGTLRHTREESITATASGTITTSYQLTFGLNQVTTVASGGDGVKLPACVGGKEVIVVNGAAANSLNVFPNTSSETINALSGGTAFAVAANKVAIFFCANDGKWYSVLTASLEDALRRLALVDRGLRRAA